MSDYQVTNYGICGECEHHEFHKRFYQGGKETSVWYCNCEDSDYYTDYTEYTDTCPMFQERGIE